VTSLAARWRLAACFTAAGAIAAGQGCNGHLDFGAGGGHGGLGGGAGGGAAGSGAQGGNSGGSCTTDADCHLSSLHCDPVSRTCGACVVDAQCTAAGLGHCDASLHRCVACVAATNCPVGQTCLAARCVITCVEDVTPSPCPAGTSCHSGSCGSCGDDNPSCAGNTAAPFCLTPPAICVACRTDADCVGPSSRCDPVRHACAACITSADCAAGQYCDPNTGACLSG